MPVSYAGLLLDKVSSGCDTAAYGIKDRGQIGIAATGTTDGSTCSPQGGKP